MYFKRQVYCDEQNLLFVTGVDNFSDASDSALVRSFKSLGDKTGTVEVGRGGDAETGVFSLKDSLRGEPSEARLCLGGEP